ncbi:hypothetical protein J2Y69_002527 [Microbacterium resistens]|uniref:Uncharacterized protein n=1 Tax=Microbacterium resistens TaxID=156977 RepID=A0ABU1SEC4_9MICO|nr:hypothetical protein [Microbacterium resistens]MDR6867919.1 hypothetical protein [Microbacterium resistens]
MVGEIAELFAFYPDLRPVLAGFRGGFIEGYGDADFGMLRIGIAYRLAQHAYDWFHYADATEAQARSLLTLAAAYVTSRSVKDREMVGR